MIRVLASDQGPGITATTLSPDLGPGIQLRPYHLTWVLAYQLRTYHLTWVLAYQLRTTMRPDPGPGISTHGFPLIINQYQGNYLQFGMFNNLHSRSGGQYNEEGGPAQPRPPGPVDRLPGWAQFHLWSAYYDAIEQSAIPPPPPARQPLSYCIPLL